MAGKCCQDAGCSGESRVNGRLHALVKCGRKCVQCSVVVRCNSCGLYFMLFVLFVVVARDVVVKVGGARPDL